MAAIKDIPVRCPKKPHDKQEWERITAATPCGLIACSSNLLNNLADVTDIHSESFDVEEQVIVGLDSMCSCHLFIDKSDFVSDIKPITPFDIQGVGGNIQAIGQGTVQLWFHCSNGLSHDKLLPNAYFAPNAPVCLISIPLLGRDTAEYSTLCTGGVKSVLTWNDTLITLQHSTPSGVPFLRAYVGHPKHHAFYNICYLAPNYSNSNGTVPASTDEQSLRDSSQDTDSSSTNLLALDMNEHMDENINHVHSLLHHPIHSDKQRD